jgi:uncharacterized membrane protein
MNNIKTILITFITIVVVDFIWLGFVAKHLYLKEMGHLMRLHEGNVSPNYLAATLVYIALVVGILLLVLPNAHTYTEALIKGALFGLIIYAVYDFTNLAILANWPLFISLVDIAWGTTLCGIVSGVAFWAKTNF